jgi:hypothetical protein
MRSQQPYRFDAPEFDYQASLQKQQAQEAADRDAAAKARARRQIEANIQELQQRPCYREHMGRQQLEREEEQHRQQLPTTQAPPDEMPMTQAPRQLTPAMQPLRQQTPVPPTPRLQVAIDQLQRQVPPRRLEVSDDHHNIRHSHPPDAAARRKEERRSRFLRDGSRAPKPSTASAL